MRQLGSILVVCLAHSAACDAGTATQAAAVEFLLRYRPVHDAHVDVHAHVERLDTAARAAGRNVRVILTSHHGEEFGERGTWGHAHTLYAEQLHVPMIVSGAGLPKGRVEDLSLIHI